MRTAQCNIQLAVAHDEDAHPFDGRFQDIGVATACLGEQPLPLISGERAVSEVEMCERHG
jgi:hypothetical protein